MITRFGDERAPLELGEGSKRVRLLVCPHCKVGMNKEVTVYSYICRCREVVRAEESLAPEEAINIYHSGIILSPEYLKMRAERERQAAAYAEKAKAPNSRVNRRNYQG